MDQDSSGTVSRVVRVLRIFAAARGDLALGDVAESLSLPPSTVHRLLKLLAGSGLVERSADGHRYQAGREFYRMALQVVGNTRTREIARPILEGVSRACGESVILCEYLPASHAFAVIDHVRSHHPLGYEVAELKPESLLWGASGRSILAFLPEAERDAVYTLAESSPAAGEKPPVRDRVEAELARIRARGYAQTEGQRIPGAVGLGVPVRRLGGHVFGSLCITAPAMRFPPDLIDRMVAVLKEHAQELSAMLGYDGEQGGGVAVRARAG